MVARSALNKSALAGLGASPLQDKTGSIKSRRASMISRVGESTEMSVIGRQKDVKANAYSDKNVDIKYAPIEPIALKDANQNNKDDEETGSRLATIVR